MAGRVFHVLNRSVRRARLFDEPGDYAALLRVLSEAQNRIPLRILAYCVMPNHFHLVMWPNTDDQLSLFMQWFTMTHTKRWHATRGTNGSGPVYQGRFKAFPVQTSRYLVNVCRYVERNALRAGLVPTAEAWPWSSLAQCCQNRNTVGLHEWPILKPENWRDVVNSEEPEAELMRLRQSVRVSSPYGDAAWCDDLGSHSRGAPRE
jgi:putative transposase